MGVEATIGWNFELDVIKEYLSRFYHDEFACLREYIANAIAAQTRVGVKDPIYVEITPKRIIIEDKGIGISKEKFKNVFMWFGRSENREAEGVQGRFGLGAKSFMMLTKDKGYMVMKTRSRETNEAYSAILTTSGAKIIDDGGKRDYGTRFEIYLETPLTPEMIGRWVFKILQHFEFSRIPVRIKATADEKFIVPIIEPVMKGGKLIGYEISGKEFTNFDKVICVDDHEIQILESNDVYELGIVKVVPYMATYYSTYSSFWGREVLPNEGAVVIGDVCVTGVYFRHLFIRIKVEDGREVEVLPGVVVNAPEPLPNRDAYKYLDEFLEALKIRFAVLRFKNSKYFHLLNKPVTEIAEQLSDKEIEVAYKLTSRIINLLPTEDERKVRYEQAIEKELPGFFELHEKLYLLLTEWPVYGVGGELDEKNRRKRVTLASVIRARNIESDIKIGFVRRRPNSRKEKIMEEAGISAIYVGSDSDDDDLVEKVIEVLKECGIEEVQKIKSEKKLVKVYDSPSFQYDVDLDRFIADWSGELVVYANKYKEFKEAGIPHGIYKLIVGPKKIYKELKRLLGDFVMTVDELKEFIRKTTIVTDGYSVFTLEDVNDEDTVVVRTVDTELLPAVSLAVGKKVCAILEAPLTPQAPFLDDWFRKYINRQYSDESYFVNYSEFSKKYGPKAAEILYLVLLNRYLCNNLYNDLVNILYECLDVEKGKTEKEIWELAKPVFAKVCREYGIIKLGDMTVDQLFRVPAEHKDVAKNSLKGLEFLHPLIGHFANYADDEDLQIRLLAWRHFRFAGVLMYNLEHNEEFSDRDDLQVIAKNWYDIRKKYFTEEEWKVLLSIAPSLKKQALADLL